MLLLIIVLLLLFGGGGGYYGYSRWGPRGGLTTVNASCAITAGAAHTARNVTATTPIGTTNSLTGAFTVN
jgi:hypothetical protein